MDKPNIIVRFFRLIWKLLGVLRALVQILILLIVIAVIVSAFQGTVVQVPDRAALLLTPSGQLVEELTEDPVSRALSDLQGVPPRETLTRDLIAALKAAADDDRIQAVVLSPDNLAGGGLVKLRELGRAIQAFRDSGKPVIAMADAYDQSQYYLAAQADEVYMHDFGAVYLDGFGYFRAYFHDALEKLRIDMNVFRVGEYKSFVEPFTRDDMSAEDREAASRWLESLWQQYRSDVAQARGIEADSLNDYANDMAARVEASGGNLAEVAAEAGLVDGLFGRLEFESYMEELVGRSDRDDQTYSAISYSDYLRATRLAPHREKSANVGVIVASGQIVDGESPPGAVGGDSLATQIGQAAQDDSIDAVVLRVDSPGGSMFASEVIYEALAALQDTGKPLVASMSSVAASGGYYISMRADEILADATTITGSIGVGALLPTFQRSLAGLGVRTDGFGTTRLSGQTDPARALGPEARRIVQASVEEAYRQFLDRVAATRDMSYERADSLARGRVWVGADALELGLVDGLGGLDEAVAAAAKRAGLEGEDYGVRFLVPEPDFRQRLALRMLGFAGRLLRWAGWQQARIGAAGLRQVLGRLDDELTALAWFNDPRDLYYHCFCELR